MIPVNIVFTVLIVFFTPVIVYLLLKSRVVGKMGCFFLEKDKSITFRLYKVQGRHVAVDDELYGVSPGRIRFIRFPMGWPALFQQVVPVSLYQREDYNPIDINDPVNWTSLAPSKDSSIEVGAVLEPRWLAAIVRGTKEGAPDQTRMQKLIPALTLGAVAAVLVFMFYVIMKVNGIESDINMLEDVLPLVR